jgi:hypothetical protein
MNFVEPILLTFHVNGNLFDQFHFLQKNYYHFYKVDYNNKLTLTNLLYTCYQPECYYNGRFSLFHF